MERAQAMQASTEVGGGIPRVLRDILDMLEPDLPGLTLCLELFRRWNPTRTSTASSPVVPGIVPSGRPAGSPARPSGSLTNGNCRPPCGRAWPGGQPEVSWPSPS
ncbi:MAG: hypothetical protein IPI34_03535 [bacterium]|nr:hypothetical protein [bacterium]